nr:MULTISPECIES: NrfD/PsrC family molybdoenzyme membrane anchor subunit [Myxococcaceae]
MPARADGRNVDPALGTLSGEGAHQQVKRLAAEHPTPDTVAQLPSEFPAQPSPTYYDQPMLKAPVWTWAIPAYFYVGGLAGATSALGAASALLAPGRHPDLLRASRWVGTAGDVVSAALLIDDLGRPSRFLHMLRVFRVTSPMSVGTYVLSLSGACNTASLVLGGRPGVAGRLGRYAELGAGALGLALCTYTGVLIANTAVPVWQLGHRELPVLFAGSAVSSAASLLQLFPLGEREQRLLHRYGVVGKAVELAAGHALERSVKRAPQAARSLKEGLSGALWQASKVLTAASLALSLLPGRHRPLQRRAAALLGTAGALALRFGLMKAGARSTLNPRASFEPQRAGLGAAAVLGPTPDPQGGKPFSFPLPVVS